MARRLGQLVPLAELVRRHAAHRSTAGLVALTFDDAYHALGAQPVREFIAHHHVPLTVFVVTGTARTGAAYWWDRVEELFPHVAADRWRAFENRCGLPEDYRRGQPGEHGPLRPLRQWVLAAYRGRCPAHFEAALSALERELGRSTTQRSMTFQELEALTAIPTVDIGVHTMSHHVLPFLSDLELHREIAGCLDRLRERFDRVVPVLAVPFGLYDERTVRASRIAGMAATLTLGATTLDRAGSDHLLPRFCMMSTDTRTGVALRLLGIREIVRRRTGPQPQYPELPSATT